MMVDSMYNSGGLMYTTQLKSWLKFLAPITLLSIAAGLQMLGALLFFKHEPNLILILSYVLISFGIYLLNRFTDDEDCINCPEQKMYFQKNTSQIAIPLALLLIASIMLAAVALLTFWHLVLIFSGVLYSVSMIPWYKKNKLVFIRLKEVVILKNISVSLLWGVTPFAIAASIGTTIQLPFYDLIVVVATFFLTTLINTTTCDVRDIEGDRLAGVKTLAAILGHTITEIILFSLAIATSIIVALLSLHGYIQSSTTLLFFIVILWTILVSLPTYLNTIKLPKVITEPLIDTQQILCGVALIVISVR